MYKESLVLLLLRAFLSALWTGPLFGLSGCQRIQAEQIIELTSKLNQNVKKSLQHDLAINSMSSHVPVLHHDSILHQLSCSRSIHLTPSLPTSLDGVWTSPWTFGLSARVEVFFGTKCHQKKKEHNNTTKASIQWNLSKELLIFDACITRRVRDTDRKKDI